MAEVFTVLVGRGLAPACSRMTVFRDETYAVDDGQPRGLLVPKDEWLRRCLRGGGWMPAPPPTPGHPGPFNKVRER